MKRFFILLTILLLQVFDAFSMHRPSGSATSRNNGQSRNRKSGKPDPKLQEALDLSKAEEESRQAAIAAQAKNDANRAQFAQQERKVKAESNTDAELQEAMNLSLAEEQSRQAQLAAQGAQQLFDLDSMDALEAPSPRDQNNGQNRAEVKRNAEKFDTPFARYKDLIIEDLTELQRALINKLVELDASKTPNYNGTSEESTIFNSLDPAIQAKMLEFYPHLTFQNADLMDDEIARYNQELALHRQQQESEYKAEKEFQPTRKKRKKLSWIRKNQFTLAAAAGAAAVLGFLLIKSVRK